MVIFRGVKNGKNGKTPKFDSRLSTLFVIFFHFFLVFLPYFAQVATCGFWPKIDRKKLFKNADFRYLKFSGFSKNGPKIDPFFGHFWTLFWTKNWPPFWPRGGPKMGHFLDPFFVIFDPFSRWRVIFSGSRNGSEVGQKWTHFWTHFLTKNWSIFGKSDMSNLTFCRQNVKFWVVPRGPRHPRKPLFGPYFGVLSRHPCYCRLKYGGRK